MAENSAFARVSKLAEKSVQALLREKKTIAVMESCTGGLLSSLLTDISGASEVFPCGLAAYSNAAKVTAGVDAGLIETEGVYSAACAEAMAHAVQKTYKTDYAVGVTGTLGRVDPANRDSTPGEVFFCILRVDEAAQTASDTEGERTVYEAFTERIELDPTLPRPEAKLTVAKAVLRRLLSLI